MSERVSVGRGLVTPRRRFAAALHRSWVALACSSLLAFGCAEAHDVDAVSPNLRDDDGGVDEGGGSAGNDGAGRGGASGSRAGSGGTGSGASGSGAAGSGAGGAGNGGGTGQPIFGNVSSCAPCAGAEGSMGALQPCCTADGECGVDIGGLNGQGRTCARQNAPGMESMSCPEYVFQGNFMLTSCCGADGFCGVMIMQTAPLGCVDPELLGDLVEPAEEMGGGMMFGGGMFGDQGGQDPDDGPVRCGSSVD
jgi:hypothetical protein